MGDPASFPEPVVSASEPRRWIAAIVGGVLLGEALWALLQLLVRDWATPAIVNAMGQGPTQNPAAFEPLPLVIAFVEACVAAIVLVLLMAWAQRRTRVVITRTVAADPMVPMAGPANVARVGENPPGYNSGASSFSAPIALSSAPAVPSARTSPITAEVFGSSTPTAAPATPAPAQAASAPAKPGPAPTPTSKKKPVYYNIVGDPIDE